MFAVAFVMLSVALFAGVTAGKLRETLRLYSELKLTRRVFAARERELATVSENRERLTRLEGELHTAENTVLPYGKVINAFAGVSMVLENNGVDELSFAISGVSDVTVPDELPGEARLLSVRGYFEGVGEFDNVLAALNALSEHKIAYTIDAADISLDGGESGKVHLKMDIYIYAAQEKRGKL